MGAQFLAGGTGSFSVTAGTALFSLSRLTGKLRAALWPKVTDRSRGRVLTDQLVSTFSDHQQQISEVTNAVSSVAGSLGDRVTTIEGFNAGNRLTTLESAEAWDLIAKVSGSDATTASTSLVDITGLSCACAANSVYEFEFVFQFLSSSAAGNKFGANFSASGASVMAAALYQTTSGNAHDIINALNTAGTAVGTTATLSVGYTKGFLTTVTNAGNLTMQFLKVTSGTATIKIGARLKVRKVA